MSPVEGLSTSWLATRMGRQPAHVEILRREGDLLGVRAAGSRETRYPTWQFDDAGKPLTAVGTLVRAARRLGIDDNRLAELMETRTGLTTAGCLADLVRAGRIDHVLEVLRTRAARPALA